ncbi:MAG: LysR family transcriptional regulator [Clostridia bacterium]|nr:LysR family transcriptional regulator [Clostridia bacterium]
MNTKLEQYKTFYIAALCGSFSEAAKKLFITQSAVSQQIRALESELGVLLFVRGKKGAKLTAQGELLFGFAQRSMNEIENAENLFARMKSLDEGSIKIGAGDTLTRYYLLGYLEEFHNRFPGVKIEIVNRVTGETLSKLNSGAVDIAFVNLPIDTALYTTLSVIEASALHDVFVAGPKYSHLIGTKLSMQDIASLPLVMLEPKSNTRKTTDSFFKANGITLNPEFELGSHDLLFDFAQKNLGIACVTEEFASSLDAMGLFKLETDFIMPERKIGICTLANTKPTPAVVKLIEMIIADK